MAGTNGTKRGGANGGGGSAKGVAAAREEKKTKSDEQLLSESQAQLQNLAQQPNDTFEQRQETRKEVEKILSELPVGTVIDTQHNHSTVKVSKDAWISTALTSYNYSDSDMSEDWVKDGRILHNHPKDLKIYKFNPKEWSSYTVRDIASWMEKGYVDKSYNAPSGFTFWKH